MDPKFTQCDGRLFLNGLKFFLMFGRSFTHRTMAHCCSLLVLSTLGLVTPSSAIATDLPTDPVTLSNTTFASIYMDAPFVQASYASTENDATNVTTENFNNLTPIPTDYSVSQNADGMCPASIAVGTVSETSQCLMYANDPYFGGATTSSSDPFVGGTHSTYAAAHQGPPLTITFPSAKKYVGFWWSAGSTGNSVSFLGASGEIVAELNANYVYDAVSAEAINALSGQIYQSADFLGHPAASPQDRPDNTPRYDSGEPFVYIHAFAPTGFHAIQLSAPGNGFEFDNLTTADVAPSINQRLVLVRDIYASQTLPTPSPNPSYEFGGWYLDSGLESYVGIPGDIYYPENSSVVLYPLWTFLFEPTYVGISPSSGQNGSTTNLQGTQISRVDGGSGWQTIFYKAFANGSALGDWTVLVSGAQNHGDGQSIEVVIPNVAALPEGTDSLKFHIDVCSDWFNATGCIPLDNDEVVFTITPTAPITYTFSYSSGNNGTITGNSSQIVGAGSSGTAVNAVANAGFYFATWSDGSTANPRTDINASGNVTVNAIFAQNEEAGGGNNGGGNNGGGNNGGGNEVVIEIPQAKSDPIVITQPEVPTKAPDREILVSKSATKTVINIAPKVESQQPLISMSASNIAIRGVTQGQRIRVTVVGKDGLTQVVVPKSDSELSALVNKNTKAMVKIEITPTSSPTLKKKAKISIDGAKKNQRVRVTVNK